MINALLALIKLVVDAMELTSLIALNAKLVSFTKKNATPNAQLELTLLDKLAENALLIVSNARTELHAKNVTPSLSYKENGALRTVTMDITQLKESAQNVLTSQELRDAHPHPSPLSADPDSSYTTKYVLITAPRELCQIPTENANLADLTVSNAPRRILATDALPLTLYSKHNAYQNALLDTSTSLESANLAHKKIAYNADLKTTTTVSDAKLLLFQLEESAFLTALLEPSKMEIDAENATPHVPHAPKGDPASLASLNSLLLKKNALLNAQLVKSLFSTSASLVKILPV
jgi:hypothetical protein